MYLKSSEDDMLEGMSYLDILQTKDFHFFEWTDVVDLL